MKKTFCNKHFETSQQTKDLFNLLDELRDITKRRRISNILINSK